MRPFHLAGVLLAILAAPAAGQVIPIRTAPIAPADRVDILASQHHAMGGVSIAVRDTLGDAAVNPAAGVRFSGARLLTAPVFYRVDEDAGAGRALPLAATAASGDWFAAGALAVQVLDGAREPELPGFRTQTGGGIEEAPPSRASGYAFGLLGRAWPASGVSLGASVLAARRSAMDGVDQLYGESRGLQTSGRIQVFRLGVLKEWPAGSTLEAVAVRSRTRVTHEVAYLDWSWDPQQQRAVSHPRHERNDDHADVRGLQLAHTRPLAAGWRIGWVLTGNRVEYPSVPRYDAPKDGFMNGPGGRGSAEAVSLGVGVATRDRPLRLAADLVWEPIRARFWTPAATATPTLSGDTIPPGGTTLESRLLFDNALVRLGAGYDWVVEGTEQAVGVRAGLAARRVDYRLAQYDHRLEAGRDTDESWVEWTPTWGTSFRAGQVEIRYSGAVTRGTQRPGAATPVPPPCDVCLDRLSVPGPMRDRARLGPVRILTHQILFSLPLGSRSRPGGES